jgi:hypothetical protein
MPSKARYVAMEDKNTSGLITRQRRGAEEEEEEEEEGEEVCFIELSRHCCTMASISLRITCSTPSC